MKKLICGCERNDENKTPRRYTVCRKHWQRLSAGLRAVIRTFGKDEKEADRPQTLQANPSLDWVAQAKAQLKVTSAKAVQA